MDDIPEEDTGTPEVADIGGPAVVEKAAANVASIADQTLLAVQQLGVGSNTNIHLGSRWKTFKTSTSQILFNLWESEDFIQFRERERERGGMDGVPAQFFTHIFSPPRSFC